MTKQSRIVVRDNNYWAIDETLPEVRNRFKRLSGKFPSKNASIVLYTGTFEDVEKISVDDMGATHYPQSVEYTTLQ